MIVQTEGLGRDFRQSRGWLAPARTIHAVSDVTLGVAQGTCLGIVGESGSGKSTLGRLLLGLMPASAGRVQVIGRDLAALSRAEWRNLRRDLALVPQKPRAALDPRCTVGEQEAEPLVIHSLARSRADLAAAWRKAFAPVGLSESLLNRYPHQLSGGQRRRVVLARALTLNPKLIVMDEPTSALDVSLQAQVMQLIAALKAQYGLTYVFISHDLRNLALIADQIAVKYAGRVVEQGSVSQVCSRPAHPYTQALLAAVPHLGGAAPERAGVRGEPPDPAALPSGCAFHPRCVRGIADCTRAVPALQRRPDGRRVACNVANVDLVSP